MRRVAYSLLATLVVAGCSTEVEGPEPQMDDEPGELSTDPSFVCNQAHGEEGTWVTLDGEAFSPLVVDAIASEDEPDVELPEVTLVLQADPTGETPDDDGFTTTLDSPLGAEDGQVRWLDDETLQFQVRDDLELPEGVYDISVHNPNGQTVTDDEAFGVLDRPELDVAIPEMTCVAQGEREVTLEGDNLLVQGDEDEVPTVDLDGEQVEVVEDSTDDCRELHNTFTDHEICEELTVRIDEDQLEAGVYDVTATNFAPAGCPSIPEEDGVTVTVNDPPQVTDIEPSPVCSEQIEYEAMEVDGDEFVTVEDEDGQRVYPEVTLGEQTYRAVDANGCEAVESSEALAAQRCDQLLIDVDDGDLADQVDDGVTHEDLHTVVTNPEPVGCHSTEDEYLTAMPRPQVEMVEPDPMCTSQYDNSFVVEGHGFAEIDGDQPVVHIEDETYEVETEDLAGCTDIETPDVETRSCEELTVTIPEGDLDVERNDVTVENPETAQCESTDDSTVQVVPPPTVEDVDPDPLCTEQEDRTLELTGEDFLNIDGELPEVAVGEENIDAAELEACQSLVVDDEDRDVAVCEILYVEIEAGMLETDIHDITVTNPEGAECSSEEAIDVETVPLPEIESVDPRAICTNDDTTPFDVEGEHLYEVEGQAPDILVDNTSYETTASSCTDVDDDVRRCEMLSFEADPDEISDEIHELVAVNPDEVGCSSEPSDPVMLAGAPELVTAEPISICEGESIEGDMSLFGEFVYDPDGDDPTVTMDQTPTDVEGFADCDTTDLGDIDVDTCTQLDTTIPEGVGDEEFDVTVQAPEPVACGQDTLTIQEVESATIDSVDPGRVCVEGGTFEVLGENIHQDASAYLNGTAATDVDVADDGTSATVTFEGPLDPPEMTLEVTNPGDCGETYEDDINIEQAPIPLYVDPSSTFDGMNTQTTIYAAGVGGGSIETVELVHPDDGSTTALDTSIDADRPYLVQATVPEGMLEEDEESVDFGVRITDEFDCQSDTFELLRITSEPTIALDEIRPPFGPQDEDTGVTITADSEIDDDEDQFEPTPRAYLNPADIDGNIETAREVSSLQYIDEIQLNGVVSSGLPLGTYDLIVVNPDGDVGVLEESYEVVDQPPPLVDGVSPGSWSNDEDDLAVDVDGQHFRGTPDVDVFCQGVDEDLDEEDMRQPDIELISAGDDFLELSVDATGLDHLDTCFMRVTNPDGTWGEYSPITVTNPASNFISFSVGPEFDTARRGPTTLGGEPARQSSFLYVVGGDSGSVEDDVYAHGERATLDRFGVPQQWEYLRFELPNGRTFGDGVRVEDFVYLIGGADETGLATDSIYRARVLDPSESPDITGLDLVYDDEEFEDEDGPDASGLDAGLYYYRVAATYSGDDPANPDGESLSSDPQPVNVPLDGARVTIEWEDSEELSTHDIDGYRIYRSVDPDDISGNEELLATVDADTYALTDDATETPDGDGPLTIGELGSWHQVGDLEHPRMAAGVDAIDDPDNDDEKLVYVVGGEDETGGLRADYEFFSVDVEDRRQQSIDRQQSPGLELDEGRSDLEVSIGYGSNAPSLSDVRPQLFVTGGFSQLGAEDDVRVATIGDDGQLDEWTDLTGMNNDRAGHANIVANDTLVVAGGQNGSPDSTARNADIVCDQDNGCPPAALGSAPTWTDLGSNFNEDRVFMDHLTFQGFWYVTGGLTDGDAATNTVDFSPIGGGP